MNGRLVRHPAGLRLAAGWTKPRHPECPKRAPGEMARATPSPRTKSPYLPLFTGVNLIFLISSTICPSRTMPDTEVIACTTFS
jgi:hypothetical protein